MMQLPGVIEDFPKYRQFAKELSQLEDVADVYQNYKNVASNVEDAKILMHDSDPEMAEMGKMEYEDGLKEMDRLLNELQIMLVPKDPNDSKNVIVEIRGAVGGEEGNIFAGDLFRMYMRYAETQKWKVEVLESADSGMGGFSYVSFSVKGKEVYSKLKYESGAHRVQRVPKTEAQGRIHTSTATVLVMPEAEDVDVQINESDLKIDTYRSSGAGGQHINKTDSAVRMTHLPTGIVVSCQEGRSQIENRENCMNMLRTKLWDFFTRKAEEERGAERRSKIGTGERSEKIRTYNYPQNRVTDHRIGYTTNSLDRVMDGALEDIIDALINEDIARKLRGE
jgi:peptide chain release factor 1